MSYPPPYDPTRPVPPTPSSAPPTTGYPTYLGAPTPPRRSNGPILAVVIALAVLLVGGVVVTGVLLVNSGDDPGRITADETPDTQRSRPAERTTEIRPSDDTTAGSGSEGGNGSKVVYEVTGSGTASIIYFKSDGVTAAQVGETDLPWRQELTLESDAAFVSVNATRADGTGELGCRITIDGKEVAKKKASGQYAIVLCTKLVL